ncbi:MAG: M48 family metallopeptidase, partial [Ignavibacteriaceae bacterium]|nr:M48 family metallopeptidase [Ignavibacteriaceae bacterium]
MQKKQSFSAEYRNQAIRALFAILFFIFVYLLTLLLSFFLIIFLFIASHALMQSYYNKYLFFLGLTTALIALILLIFLIMFYFRKSTVDRSGWIEINREAQPKLFDLIGSIAEQIEVNFPQKVFVASGVDAMVFYDLNFRNLFFPSKENLVIGLGLINSVNESEFKAILAHEFGHFTQRSLNVYSYVYIENQIIYKMLIDEQFYQSLLQNFFQTIFRLAWIVVFYSRIVRWILRNAYEIVSKSYMALSREMENHADEISARVAGSVPAITSLLRASLAMDSFNYIWQFYFNRVSENVKTENIYPQHYHVMMSYAEKFGMEIKFDLPHVSKEIINRFNRSKLVIKDQWASHPTVFDRVKKLEDLNVEAVVSGGSAWNLFSDGDNLQKKLTEKLFRNWQYSDTPVILDFKAFKKRYSEEVHKYRFDKKYNHFYELRDISVFDIKQAIETSNQEEFKEFEEIFTDKNVDLVHQFSGLDRDLKTLESITKKEIAADSFDYDGVKYQSEESNELLEELKKRHEVLHKEINNLDIKIFKFYLNLAKVSGHNEELLKCYEDYFYLLREDKENLKIYLDLINSMQFIWRVTSFSQIRNKMITLKEKEADFGSKLKKILKDERYISFIAEEKGIKLEEYLSKDWQYFTEPKYNDEALAKLEEALFLF